MGTVRVFTASYGKMSQYKFLKDRFLNMLYSRTTRFFLRLALMTAALLLVVAVCAAQQAVSNAPTTGSGSASGAPGTAPPSNGPATSLPAKAAATDPVFQQRINRYRLAPGDSFDINFDLSPEFNQTAVSVQPDGYVTLRGVGDVKVQGQTVPELTQTLRTAYSKILNSPIISIVLKDFEKPYFVADGQIGKPGKYDLRGQITLTQAIAIAGGFTDASKHSQVLLFRRVDDQWMEAKIINVKKMEKMGDLTEDPLLHPGDMLFVPKNTFSKIEHFLPVASMGTFFQPPIP
jgi:polysaccharide biosynthesis/export protein